MANEDGEERTEQPTPRRRQEAREQGRVPRSLDLTAAAGLLGGLVLLNFFGPGLLETLLDLTRELGRNASLQPTDLGAWINRTLYASAAVALPFLLSLMVVSVVATLVQSGWVFTWNRLVPKLEKLSPVKGVRRLFSGEALVRLGFGVLKMVLLALVAYTSVMSEIHAVLASGTLAPQGSLHLAARVVFTLSLRMALVLLLLGLLDFFYQRWSVERGLRMTKQEVKDELKRMEGDPLIRQRRRQAQLKLALQRIGIDVPKSDVVVTNPTEYAVALKYDEATMSAPRLLAKGKDLLALRIRQVARQHGVPIVQRPPLARALYASVEVGEEVPPRFYRAVAEVLAYVYQLAGKAAAG